MRSIWHRFIDPAHSWLKVRRQDLEELDIADKITAYSYQRGDYAYLEEDTDMTTFLNAYLTRQGFDPDTFWKNDTTDFYKAHIREHYADRSSKLRNYKSYHYRTPEEKAERERLIAQLLDARDWTKIEKREMQNAELSDLHYWEKLFL